jgi:hypothetical protein
MSFSKAALGYPLVLACFAAHAAEPFPTRDQNPFLTGVGLPAPFAARVDDATLAVNFNWGSTAMTQTSVRDALLVDAETKDWQLAFTQPLGERFALRLDVAHRTTNGGSLDSFIDDFHRLFGLPDGARDGLPKNDLSIRHRRGNALALDRQRTSSGFTDVSLAAAYRFVASPRSAVSAWVSVAAPIGSTEDFTADGSVDVSAALAAERTFGDNWSAFGQISGTHVGSDSVLSQPQERWVWATMAGLGFRLTSHVELKLQVDVHSAPFADTSLDYLGEAAILTVGGDIRWGSGWRLDIGISEDVIVEASPDVVFVFALRKSL